MAFISSMGVQGGNYNKIKSAMEENGLELADIRGTPEDLKELFGIPMILAKKIKRQLDVQAVKQACSGSVARVDEQKSSLGHRGLGHDMRYRYQESSKSSGAFPVYGRSATMTTTTTTTIKQQCAFVVTLRGQQGKLIVLNKRFTKESRVKSVIQAYQDQECLAESTHVEEIVLHSGGKPMEKNRTLGWYNIVSDMNRLTVMFKTRGGALATEDRVRKIQFQKCGLTKTSLADVLIGYDDDDGIPRALLDCQKHAMTADTMYSYIATTLASNPNQKEISCPYPTCGRALDWQRCTQIADMDKNEYAKWTGLIEKRSRAAGNVKECPNCGAYCVRGDGVAIFRMNCSACKRQDWCWECAQTWKGSGSSMCCNQNCDLVREANERLAKCPLVKVAYIDKEMPEFRACPTCLTFMEYTRWCKHMKCVGCAKEFCFVCLAKKTGNVWPCGSIDNACEVAARQKFV